MRRVDSFLQAPREPLSKQRDAHERAWLWKMFDRAFLGDAESDHRRHWLLCDLAQAWCNLTARHYLGPKKTFQAMKTDASGIWPFLEAALRAGASPDDIERAVHAVAGPRKLTS
jgi:hypothetical protein